MSLKSAALSDDWSSVNRPVVELVPSTPTHAHRLASAQDRASVLVLTLHDGNVIPRALLDNPAVAAMADDGRLQTAINETRDWGADMVAHQVASDLGLGGHYRLTVARAVMDFNRFPGFSGSHTNHMDLCALSGPVANELSWHERRWVLSQCYDRISDRVDEAVGGRSVVLSVHTYDERNSTHTRRPEMSLLTRSHSYQNTSRLPDGLFDPLFPSVLAESSANPMLRERLALTLQQSGIHVEHNYPYLLPDGSFEIRTQPWRFFNVLQREFEDADPDAMGLPSYGEVWEMLLNTNLRDAQSVSLSNYLHRLSGAPPGQDRLYEQAHTAYERIRRFLADRQDLVDAYRFSVDRPRAITVEVRKDLVYDFDGRTPVRPNVDRARAIGRLLACGISRYIEGDCVEMRARVG